MAIRFAWVNEKIEPRRTRPVAVVVHNPAAAGVILAKYTKLPQAVVDRIKHGQFAETLLVSDYQPVIDVAAKYGVLPKTFPASEYFYR